MSRADTVHCFCSFRKVSEFRKKTMNCERLNCFAIFVRLSKFHKKTFNQFINVKINIDIYRYNKHIY